MKFKGIKIFLAATFLFSVTSCDMFDLDINIDPNNPSKAAPELLLTSAQVNAIFAFAGGMNNNAAGFVGQTTSSDDFFFNNQSYNGTWNFLYTTPLKDLDELITASSIDVNGDGKADSPHYLGVSQVLKSYYFSIMVDFWGDVPYSEAFKGNATPQIKTSVYDDDAVIYADCIKLLDDAIANFALPSAVTIKGDLYYSGNITRWRKAATTLKLKLLLQTRLVNPTAAADIQAVINSGNLITAAVDNFAFNFSKSINPDFRHPWHSAGYSGADYGFDYLGHQFMLELITNNDPRLPFYIKRQTKTILNPIDPSQKQTIPCSQRSDCTYGYFPTSKFVSQKVYAKDPGALTTTEAEYLAGFFGRDRADPSGVPNDTGFRTAIGVYPAGGLYDDAPEGAINNKGTGNGIFPIATTWMVKFWEIEAMLTLGITVPGETVVTLLTKAMNEQFTIVNAMGVVNDPGTVAITAAAQTTYVNAQIAKYNSATNKLGTVLKQAWFTNWGNGLELYNTFRRTGYPNDLQLPLQLPGNFALRVPYAQDELNLNPNTPVKPYDKPEAALFWDQLKFQFVK